MARLAREVKAEGKTLVEGVMIPPEQLILAENSRRFGPIEQENDSLMLSILDRGQIQDVVVRLDKDNRPVVVVGEQRVKAILQLNSSGVQPPVKVRCTIRDLDEAAAFVMSVAENDARNEPSTADRAHAVKTLVEKHGKTQAEVAAIYNKSQQWVSDLLAISALPTPILKRVHIGEITYRAAVLLAGQDKTTRKLVLGSIGGLGSRVNEDAVQIALDVLAKEVEEPPAPGPEAAVEPAKGAPFTKWEEESIGHSQLDEEAESEGAMSLKTGQVELPLSGIPEPEQGEMAPVEPKPKKKRGRPRMTKAQKAEKKTKQPLSLKAVRAFFEDQAGAAEEGEPSVWNELCGGIVEWMDHKFGDRAMIARGKTACGLDG